MKTTLQNRLLRPALSGGARSSWGRVLGEGHHDLCAHPELTQEPLGGAGQAAARTSLLPLSSGRGCVLLCSACVRARAPHPLRSVSR